MQINNTHQAAQVSGLEANKFGFEMNAKMYDILISKMYTNKPGAVIRELSANAWDAHVEAGQQDKPFDIHLPSWLDKTFFIRDYGTGIPHDRFEHIYTNVGSSTKENTNDLIGGFGLGSKTPFTMTDTFMVENWNNGIKSTWVCFKDKGEPSVSLVSKEPSDEPSGLKVSFSFDEGDVPEFTKQVTRQLRYFPVKPNVTGGEGKIEFENLPDGWETKEYFYSTLVSKYSHNRKHYVVMGNVAYELNPDAFDYSYRDLFSKSLTIKVPIGSVDIPPSREHLEMTPRTKVAITKVLDKIKTEYTEDLKAKINACKNEWELRKVIFECNTNLIKGDRTDILWKGEEIPWLSFRNSFVTNIGGYPIRCIHRSYMNVYRSSDVSMRNLIDGKIKLYVMDLGIGFVNHINNTYDSLDTSGVVVLHVTPNPVKTYAARVAEAVKKVEETVGVKPELLSSVFGFPPAKSKTSVTKGSSEPNQVFLVDSHIHDSSSLRSELKEVDTLPKDAYYVELVNWSIESKLSVRSLLSKGLRDYLDKPLYLVRKKSIPKLDPSMQLLTQSVLDKIVPKIEEEYRVIRKTELVRAYLPSVTSSGRKVLGAIGTKEAKVYLRYYDRVVRKNKGASSTSISILYRQITGKTIKEPEVTSVKKINTLVSKVESVLSLVSKITSGWGKQDEHVDTLIKLITNK